jgi:CDP-diacylglycerol---serine O-phosphatidyltransferase
MKKQVLFIPNVITAFGLACGLFVIFKINLIEPVSDDYCTLFNYLMLILFAAFADLADGAIARIFQAKSEFGFFLDSLADAVSFGVAPSVLLLNNFSAEQGTLFAFLAILSGMTYSICGILRLTRFSVTTTLAKGNSEEEQNLNKNFTGLPIPAAAIAAISTNLFFISPFAAQHFPFLKTIQNPVLLCIWVILGFFMISRWKFPSLKTFNFKVPSFPLVLITVITAIFIIYGALHFFSIMLMIIAWGYILLGIILSTIRIVAGKKSKTLEDFEPEHDDPE